MLSSSPPGFRLESASSSSFSSTSLIGLRLRWLPNSHLGLVLGDELWVSEGDEYLLPFDLEVVDDTFSGPLVDVVEVGAVLILSGCKVLELDALGTVHGVVSCSRLGVGESERSLLEVAVLVQKGVVDIKELLFDL